MPNYQSPPSISPAVCLGSHAYEYLNAVLIALTYHQNRKLALTYVRASHLVVRWKICYKYAVLLIDAGNNASETFEGPCNGFYKQRIQVSVPVSYDSPQRLSYNLPAHFLRPRKKMNNGDKDE